MRIVFFLLVFVLCPLARAQDSVSENSVKAAFIFHFLNYVDWPEDDASYYVCIPDDAAFRSVVEKMLQAKTVKNHPIVVTDQANTCHILVSDRVPAIDSMLTIGPLQQGALLEFRMIDNKLKFAADLNNIKKSRLKISSQLLKLAILEGS